MLPDPLVSQPAPLSSWTQPPRVELTISCGAEASVGPSQAAPSSLYLKRHGFQTRVGAGLSSPTPGYVPSEPSRAAAGA